MVASIENNILNIAIIDRRPVTPILGRSVWKTVFNDEKKMNEKGSREG
jgi:hypothetical protein